MCSANNNVLGVTRLHMTGWYFFQDWIEIYSKGSSACNTASSTINTLSFFHSFPIGTLFLARNKHKNFLLQIIGFCTYGREWNMFLGCTSIREILALQSMENCFELQYVFGKRRHICKIKIIVVMRHRCPPVVIATLRSRVVVLKFSWARIAQVESNHFQLLDWGDNAFILIQF